MPEQNGDGGELHVTPAHGSVFTFTVTFLIVDPPLPVHVKVYVDVTVGETDWLPEVSFDPDHATEAKQDVALVDDQASVDEPP